jgi:hypothetical protein
MKNQKLKSTNLEQLGLFFRKVFSTNLTMLFAFLIIFSINGCDCITDGNGVVVDSETNLPLDNVVAKSYIDYGKRKSFESEMTTDSLGIFTGSTNMTGGFFGCPDLEIEISKSGYITKTVTNPYNDTIKLIKE